MAIGGKVIARDDRGAAQGRDGEVLRRRRDAETQAAGEAERGQAKLREAMGLLCAGSLGCGNMAQ